MTIIIKPIFHRYEKTENLWRELKSATGRRNIVNSQETERIAVQ